MGKFSEQSNEILTEKTLKVDLLNPANYGRADGLVSMSAINDISKGIRQIYTDLENDGYETDDIDNYVYTLINKIIMK